MSADNHVAMNSILPEPDLTPERDRVLRIKEAPQIVEPFGASQIASLDSRTAPGAGHRGAAERSRSLPSSLLAQSFRLPNMVEESDDDTESRREEEEEEEWISSPMEELRSDQPLLPDVPEENSFHGITIGELQNMPEVPKIPEPYRHDKLVDPSVYQSQDRPWEDLDGTESMLHDETREELERLQIETVVGLVESIEVEVGGARVQRKLLFLSNKQARLLPLDNIDKVMSGLDFYPRPKLVIRLVMSNAAGCGQFIDSLLLEHHWTDCSLQTEDLNLTHCFTSEINGLNGLRNTEFKIQSFLKECLVPLARQHNALVIMTNSACSLAKLFGRICDAEAERRRGHLGFYVLALLEAPNLLLSSKNPNTTAFQLRRGSKNWQKHEEKMWYVQEKSLGDESMFYNHYVDAPDGCTHYIVADCIKKDEYGFLQRDWSAISVLRSRLVQAMLSHQIPGFAVATLQRWGGYRNVRTLADGVARGIPLLLLDSREPPEHSPTTVEDAISHLSRLDDQLAQENTGNFYTTSTLAFLHQALHTVLHNHRRKSQLSDIADLVAKAETIPLWLQLETLMEETLDSGIDSAEENACMLHQKDDKHAYAKRLVEGFLTMMGEKTTLTQPDLDISEVPKKHFKDILLRTIGQLLRSDSKQKLDEFLEYYSLRCLSKEHLKKITSARNSPFCVKNGMKADRLFKRILQVAPGADNWQDARQYILSCLREECLKFDGKFQQRSHLPHSADTKGVFLEVLVSPLTYSANLSDLPRIEKMLMLVNADRRVDRVDEVDLRSCQVLQRAWADVDVYHHVATQMKWVAKISFAIVLLTGYAITVLTVTTMNVPDALPEDTTNNIILGLTVSLTVTSALMTYVDPTVKWQQLRAAALTLEAEIWKFRCSAGAYARDMMSNNVESAQETLSLFVSVTEDSVLKSAGISESSFLSTFSFSRAPASVRIYKHGQYHGAAWKGAITSNDDDVVDDHYSPLTAREYMALRFHSHVQFYQRRLPTYARRHTLHQVVLALASGLLTILVFLKGSEWCALCTAFVAAATAWTEFTSTKRKMRRYSQTVHQAHQVLLWWQSLPRMQQSTNFVVLVQRCEACFESEHESWVSSMSSQLDGSRKVGHEDEDGDSQKDKSHAPVL